MSVVWVYVDSYNGSKIHDPIIAHTVSDCNGSLYVYEKKLLHKIRFMTFPEADLHATLDRYGAFPHWGYFNFLLDNLSG